MELIGIFFVASGLLLVAGVAKTVTPNDTARALVLLVPASSARGQLLNVTRQALRVGAALEAALGLWALLFPGMVTAALVAASYTLFVCVTYYARKHGGPLSSCGCFGRPDTPATGFHVVLNVVFASAAVTVAIRQPHVMTLVSVLESQPWNGVPLLFTSGVGVWLAYLALSPLAALDAARRLVGGTKRRAVST